MSSPSSIAVPQPRGWANTRQNRFPFRYLHAFLVGGEASRARCRYSRTPQKNLRRNLAYVLDALDFRRIEVDATIWFDGRVMLGERWCWQDSIDLSSTGMARMAHLAREL